MIRKNTYIPWQLLDACQQIQAVLVSESMPAGISSAGFAVAFDLGDDKLGSAVHTVVYIARGDHQERGTYERHRPLCVVVARIYCARETGANGETNCCCCGLVPRRDALGALHYARTKRPSQL